MNIIARFREDIDTVFREDPAARSWMEVILCYSGLHAIWFYRFTHFLWSKGFKIEARIQGNKVVIAKDAIVAKKGDVISENAAKILAKLGVEPMEIGIDVKAVWEHGLVYKAEVLNVDEAAILAQLMQAHAQAVNVAVFAGIMNSTTAPLVIAKAAREATALEKIVSEKKPAEHEHKEHAEHKEGHEHAEHKEGHEHAAHHEGHAQTQG